MTLTAGGSYPVGAEYAWYDDDPALPAANLVSTEENPVIDTFSMEGTYAFWLTVTVNDCTSPAGSTDVVIDELPKVTATNDGVDCICHDRYYTHICSYRWSFST